MEQAKGYDNKELHVGDIVRFHTPIPMRIPIQSLLYFGRITIRKVNRQELKWLNLIQFLNIIL
ncbi:hypothetical protein KUH03_05185 [Sphingobacterium sp. E70]|uniref:hypothetical protein n=1 Tax=Sphingobacterium sp. E70 TaxID=2853439 RepID=UPI00211CB32A|nr:hypothetical protein [Sphingobacterium sp. E70]ULT26310.1 hypothetical protein KUH03_05185 [Sphingobacterium sp. E70]